MKTKPNHDDIKHDWVLFSLYVTRHEILKVLLDCLLKVGFKKKNNN